jgi:hypothetical protein
MPAVARLVLGVLSVALVAVMYVLWFAGPKFLDNARANAAYGVVLFSVPLLVSVAATRVIRERDSSGLVTSEATPLKNDEAAGDRRVAVGDLLAQCTFVGAAYPTLILALTIIIGPLPRGTGV